MNKKTYEFGEYLLDLDEKRLLRNGQTVSLQPKVFELLTYFVERKGELVSRDDLMSVVWKDTFVEESNIRFCIHSLRKALGKDHGGGEFLETVPKSGYRFVADVAGEPSEASIREISQEIARSNNSDKARFGNRKWLISASAIVVIGLLLGAFAWQKSRVQLPKNALGFSQLAVLPFDAVAENEREMQLGLMAALITNLSKIRQLKVLPNASVREFAGRDFDALQAGKQVNADSVLAGTYRFDGENVIVNARILRVSDGETLWTESFTATGKTEIERETAVALRTARLFSLIIADAEDVQSLARLNLNKEAVQNYLSARKIWRKNELFRRDEMFGLYEKVTSLEPNWALAYASYSEALLSSDEFAEEKDKIRTVAQKSIELDESLPQPFAVLGESYRWFDWDWDEAESQLNHAISLDPDYAPAHYKNSRLLMVQRRFAESEIELNKAIEIEPFSPIYYSGLCELYSADDRLDEAISACQRARQIEPTHWRVKKLLFWIFVRKEMFDEIDETFLTNLSPAERLKDPLAIAVANKDLRSYWKYQIDRPITNGDKYSTGLAMYNVQVGQTDKALDYLEKAFEQRDLGLPMVNSESSFDPLRNNARFVDLMRKIGFKK